MRQKLNQIKALFAPLIFCITVLQLSSCYEDIEGCNDPLAANYLINYDIPCQDGCCNYPNVSINWTHLYAQENYNLNSTYTNLLGNSFRVLDQKMYFGNFVMEGNDGPIPLLETIEYPTQSESIDVVTNYFLLKKTITSSNFSMIKYAGEINNVSFNTKLNDVLNNVDATTLRTSSPLSNNENMRDSNNDFYSAYFNITYGQDFKDTVGFYIKTDDLTQVGFTEPNVNIQGNEVEIDLQINYDQLFGSINFNEGSMEEIKSKMEESLPQIFSEIK